MKEKKTVEGLIDECLKNNAKYQKIHSIHNAYDATTIRTPYCPYTKKGAANQGECENRRGWLDVDGVQRRVCTINRLRNL